MTDPTIEARAREVFHRYVPIADPNISRAEIQAGCVRAMVAFASTPSNIGQGDVEQVERDIRIAIWNAAMSGGMGQDLSQAFIRRAMAEPPMLRALAALASRPIERQDNALREALERIADPKNTHFAGDAQVVARMALNKSASAHPTVLDPVTIEAGGRK